jgi:PAS domain S-box-containing protein
MKSKIADQDIEPDNDLARMRQKAFELETIMDAFPGLIFYKDIANRFIMVNKFFADAHQKQKEYFKGVSCFDLYPLEQAQAYWDDDREVIEQKKSKINIIERWKTETGDRWVSTTKVPFVFNNKVIGIIGISVDITPLKDTEDKLIKSEKIIRLMTSEVKDLSIITLDKDGHITSWNEGARLLKGYDASEMIGKTHELLYLSMDRSRGHPAALLKQADVDGKIEEIGQRVRKDGTKFWADVIITAIRNSTGELIGFTEITRDITKQKEAEENLQMANERLLRSNEDLEQFAYIASHDLRSPLRAIDNLSQWIVEDLGTDLPPDSANHVQLLRRRVQRMETMLDGILQYSRAGRSDLEARECPVFCVNHLV